MVNNELERMWKEGIVPSCRCYLKLAYRVSEKLQIPVRIANVLNVKQES
jgi:hypothetical protein